MSSMAAPTSRDGIHVRRVDVVTAEPISRDPHLVRHK